MAATNEEIILCKECKTRPAILRKKTGKPLNGLCGYCRSKKAAKTMRKRRKERNGEPGNRGIGEPENRRNGENNSVTIDLTRYPQLRDIIYQFSEKLLVPVDHVIISLLAEALVKK